MITTSTPFQERAASLLQPVAPSRQSLQAEVSRAALEVLCLFQGDWLAHGAAGGIKDQNPVVRGHHRDPALAKGDSLGFYPLGQGYLGWQAGAICRQADDKQADYHYKPANHHHC